MKKAGLIVAFLFYVFCANAQAPQKMSYQMVVRGSSNMLIANQTVGVRISILQGSATGTAAFVETHAPTTNANGLASLVIGDGTAVTGSFAAVDWANGPYFIKTEIDPTGGTSYTITGTSQLMSVPYALFAGGTPNLGKTHLVISGELSNTEAAAKIAAEGGPNTQFLWIQYTSKLTSINISNLTNLTELVIQRNQQLTSISFPNLTTITSKFSIVENEVLTSISFPSFVKSAYTEVLNNAVLTNFSFPVLAKVASDFNVSTNPVLTSMSTPALLSSGNMLVSNNPKLAALSFPVLKTTRTFNISNNILLTNLSIPALNSVSYFYETGNLLASIAAPALSTITTLGNPPTNDSLQNGLFIGNPLSAAGNISFPSLKIAKGTINLSSKQNMTSLSFPVLQQAAGIILTQNIGLTSFSAPLLINNSGALQIQSGSSVLNTVILSQLTTCGELQILVNALLNNISFPQLTTVNGNIYVSPNLDALSFPVLASCGNFTGNTGPSFSLPLLTTVGDLKLYSGGTSTLLSFPQLTTAKSINITGGVTNGGTTGSGIAAISFPQLSTTTGTITIGNLNGPSPTPLNSMVLGNINFPLLTTVGGGLSICAIGLTTLNLPSLSTGGINILYSKDLTTLSTPLLTTSSGISIYRCTSLTNFSPPLLQSSGDIQISENSSLVSLSFPALTSWQVTGVPSIPYGDISYVRFSYNKLSTTSVNGLLNKLVNISPPMVIGKTIELRQTVPAPPTGQGLIDKATLISRPNTVNTD